MKTFTEKQIEELKRLGTVKEPGEDELKSLTDSIRKNGKFVVESRSGLICKNTFCCEVNKKGKVGLILRDRNALKASILTYKDITTLEDKNYFKNTVFFNTKEQAEKYFNI